MIMRSRRRFLALVAAPIAFGSASLDTVPGRGRWQRRVQLDHAQGGE
jgi:hypothetical protein